MIKTFARDLFATFLMAIASVCCGFVLNQIRDNPLPLVYLPKSERVQKAIGRLSTEAVTLDQPGSLAGLGITRASDAAEVHELDLATFRKVVEKQSAILDARPDVFHRLGHVPGAINL